MLQIDYKNPDYSAMLEERAARLDKIRADRELMQAARVYYRTHPWQFISDWGMTFEPRNIERGLIPLIPFVLWPRQVDYVQWLYRMWQASERGMCEKSRDCGVTWLTVGFGAAMWLFEPGFTIGYGSRKEDLVDKTGDPKSIFEMLRHFLNNLPVDFMPKKWTSARMQISNQDSGAAIIGEAGDNIGRGGRASMYIVDEAAFVEHQEIVDRALSQTTNCQIDISTPNGSGNQFYRKRMRLDKSHRLFIFDWRDDPRKDDAWYARLKADPLLDPVTIAQEIDRDYNASTEDAFIPGAWVASSIDAHKKLGFKPSGLRVAGFDPADVGDAKAVVCRHGSVILQARQLRGGDITQAIPWAFEQADEMRADIMRYDADGMGLPSMKLALLSMAAGRMNVMPYSGAAAVEDPDKRPDIDREGKTNQETYTNYRAQTWTWLRERFRLTHDAVQRANAGLLVMADPDNLISIASSCDELVQLQAELSRPKRIFGNNGKIKVESKADMKARGVDSPNLADACVMAIATKRPPVRRPMLPTMPQRRMTDKGAGY